MGSCPIIPIFCFFALSTLFGQIIPWSCFAISTGDTTYKGQQKNKNLKYSNSVTESEPKSFQNVSNLDELFKVDHCDAQTKSVDSKMVEFTETRPISRGSVVPFPTPKIQMLWVDGKVGKITDY